MAAKKTKKKAGSSKAGYDLCVAMLTKDSSVAYADVRDAAERKGIAVYPIVYGRAKAALGLVSVAKRGQGKAKKRAAAAASGVKRRGPGRPRKNPQPTTSGGSSTSRRAAAGRQSSGGVSGIESIIASIKDAERERDRAVSVLRKIRDMIDAAI